MTKLKVVLSGIPRYTCIRCYAKRGWEERTERKKAPRGIYLSAPAWSGRDACAVLPRATALSLTPKCRRWTRCAWTAYLVDDNPSCCRWCCSCSSCSSSLFNWFNVLLSFVEPFSPRPRPNWIFHARTFGWAKIRENPVKSLNRQLSEFWLVICNWLLSRL